MSGWTQQEALTLCIFVEQVCPDYGCHVALTGGTLYKGGTRKDCDLLFYRIRQVPSIDVDGLLAALVRQVDFELGSRHGWVQKAFYHGKNLDLFFPDTPDDWGYPEPAPEFTGFDLP